MRAFRTGMSSRKKKSGGRASNRASARRKRNRPCPCGSGRTFDSCCGDNGSGEGVRGEGRSYVPLTIILLLLAGALGFAAWGPWRGDPEPWEYDGARDRYWHPDHGHWHDGRPPGDPESPPVPDTPRPWAYDEVNDRYWHPLHRHWHDGRPPEDPWRTQPTTAVPEPWEYDAANNRHWDPDHGHWHSGPPPPPGER